MNNRIHLKSLLLICIFTSITLGNEWVSLFNGKNLDGWTKRGGEATFKVENDAIAGLNGPGHNTFLCSDKTYSDFELEFDVKLFSPLNSGVQIRSESFTHGNNGNKSEVIRGPQVEIEQGPAEAGYIYGEQAGGWMTPGDKLIPHDAFKNNDWNHYRIVARGARIQTYINGKQISDLVHEKNFKAHPKGFIGLQVHAINAPAGSHKVAWKNIQIRETDTKGWDVLFNGKDLSGWTPKVKGYKLGENPGNIFRVQDGVIKVSYDKFDKFTDQFGHLFFEQPFSSYIFRMEYRFVGKQTPGGPGWAYKNSGIMIHGQTPESMKVDQDFPTSIEVQLLGADEGQVRQTGNLCSPDTKYEKDGKVVTDHCVSSTSESYTGEQWVQVEIHVDGSKEIVHLINGREVMRYQKPQLDNGTLLDSGSISLQAESHGCEFRNIEIKPIDR